MSSAAITKPTPERIEECRLKWAGIAELNGWLAQWQANGKHIAVWHDADGNVTDSIYLNEPGHTKDVLVLDDDDEGDES